MVNYKPDREDQPKNDLKTKQKNPKFDTALKKVEEKVLLFLKMADFDELNTVHVEHPV